MTGVAVALRRDGDTLADLRVAFTGTNPRPVRLAGTERLCGGPLDARVFDGLDALVRDQIMAMKTTFTPGHYRRRVAGVLARRLVQRLFDDQNGLTRRQLCSRFGQSLTFAVDEFGLSRWSRFNRAQRRSSSSRSLKR